MSRNFNQMTNHLTSYDNPPASRSDMNNSTTSRNAARRPGIPSVLSRSYNGTLPSVSEVLAATRRERSARLQNILGPTSRRRPRSSSAEDEDGRETPRGDEGATETDGGRHGRRNKRRKTQHAGSLPQQKQSIRYGHYGQVESGKLKMELVSCDGGEHQDRRHPSISLGPENVLRLDKSVYSSERSNSNLILQHADEMPFCLEKLHIVGPEHGFTAPVREGIVYIGMTMHDLQPYLDPPYFARRSGLHTPPYRRAGRALGRRFGQPSANRTQPRPNARDDSPGLTLQEALQDPHINGEFESRRHERQDYARRADQAHDLVSEDEDDDGNLFLPSSDSTGRPDPSYYCDPPERERLATETSDESHATDTDDESANSPSRHRFQPVTLLSDDELAFEDTSSREILDFRLDRMSSVRPIQLATMAGRRSIPLPPRQPRDDDDNDMAGFPPARHDRLDYLMDRSRLHDRVPHAQGRSSRRHQSSNDIDKETADPALPADGSVTATRFHIKYCKHKVAIKFDPPVSGRFILLKLWANGKGNVDVQAIVAKGFGGCRFFPAVEVR